MNRTTMALAAGVSAFTCSGGAVDLLRSRPSATLLLDTSGFRQRCLRLLRSSAFQRCWVSPANCHFLVPRRQPKRRPSWPPLNNRHLGARPHSPRALRTLISTMRDFGNSFPLIRDKCQGTALAVPKTPHHHCHSEGRHCSFALRKNSGGVEVEALWRRPRRQPKSRAQRGNRRSTPRMRLSTMRLQGNFHENLFF